MKKHPVLHYFLTCVVVLTFMFALMTSCSSSDTTIDDTTTDIEDTITDTDNGTTNDSTTDDNTTDENTSDSDLTECFVGETVTTNTYSITLVGYETVTDSFFTPQNGEYVGVNFIIENISEEEATLSSMLQFNCYVDGFAVDLDIFATSLFGDSVDATLASGRKVNGYLTFDVDSSWQTIEIDFTDEALWESSSVRFIVNK